MIRAFVPRDLADVMELWLSANLDAHSFVLPSYWHSHWDAVAQALPAAEVWVFEEAGTLLGFVGLVDGYIAGLFVRRESRGRGIGAALLRHCKARYAKLTLHVFEENTRARVFYAREGFAVEESTMSQCPPHRECAMTWCKESVYFTL